MKAKSKYIVVKSACQFGPTEYFWTEAAEARIGDTYKGGTVVSVHDTQTEAVASRDAEEDGLAAENAARLESAEKWEAFQNARRERVEG